MPSILHCLTLAGVLLLATAPLAQAEQAAPPGSIAATPADDARSAPATAASSADPVDLGDIRNFSRVYEVVRQAYVEKVDNKTLMRAAIDGMLSGLDPHSEYLDKQGLAELTEDTTGQYSGLGIEVLEVDGALRIVSPIDDTPAARAGIKPGNTIVKINGKTLDEQNIDTLYKDLRGAAGSPIALSIVHDKHDTPVAMNLVRETISMTSVRLREIEPGYAYIRLSQFQQDTAGDLQNKLEDLVRKDRPKKGAVLDLRANPGGLLTSAVGVADGLLDRGAIVTTRGRLADANLRFNAHPGDLLGGAPLIVLTDNGTASAAERRSWPVRSRTTTAR